MAEFDTANATATADDILNGKTAYVKGEKIKGAIQSKLGGVFTPTMEPQVICPIGVYASSAFSIKGDANLKPANIRKGVEIFGVAGTMQGNDTPSGTLPDNMRTISVESNNHDGGTVYGGGAVSEGMTVTVSANPVGKFNFYGWEESGSIVSEDAEYTFKAESSRNLKAMFGDIHKSLPEEYTEVEWIQNLGTSSYFHISVSGKGDNYVEVSFPNGMGNGYQRVLEFPSDAVTYVSTKTGRFLHYYYSGGYLTQKQIYPTVLDDDIYGITIGVPYATSTTINIPTATPSESQIIRIHYAKLCGHELIPCTNKDGVAGLYDLLDDNFITPVRGRFITIYDGNFYTISLASEHPQWGTISGDGAYEEGASVTVTAEPNEGYKFVAWKENGEIVSNSATYTFTAERDRQLAAEFAVRPSYSISVDVEPSGSGEVTGDGRYYENESVSLEAFPNNTYKFSGWKEGSDQVSANNPYTFIAENNRNLTAEFIEKSLPAGYTKVEYIQSGGRSVVSTGLRPTSTTKFVMDVEPVAAPKSSELYFFNSSTTGYYFYATWSTSGIGFRSGNGSTIIASPDITLRRMLLTLDAESKTCSVDDVSKKLSSNTMNNGMLYIQLLAYNGAGTSGLSAKLYSCQIYESNTLVRDFIPCINSENVAGMYDAVEDTFYHSNSSTPFTAGPTI